MTNYYIGGELQMIECGKLIFGVDDNDNIVGLTNMKKRL